MARWNQELLEKYVKEYDNHIIFGAVYPVYMEKSFLKAVRDKGSINIMAEFARYMHNKQNRDLYYAKALVYTSEDEHLTGCYTLTQEVFSIFPVEPYIPFNSGLEPDTKVTDWDVYFVINIDGEYKTAGHVSFWPFIEYVRNKVSYTMFDEKHVILKMNKKQIEEVVKGT
jgi:hypothetical protein